MIIVKDMNKIRKSKVPQEGDTAKIATNSDLMKPEYKDFTIIQVAEAFVSNANIICFNVLLKESEYPCATIHRDKNVWRGALTYLM